MDEEQCECCGFEAELQTYKNGMPRRDFRLCEICAATFLSHAVIWPSQCNDEKLYKSIGFIANLILSKISK